MLTPQYLQGCATEIEDLYAELNQNITNDICRRIVKTGYVTDTAAWQAKQVQESGKLFDELVSDVSKATGKDSSVIRQMFMDAGVTAVKYDAQTLNAVGIGIHNGLSDPMKQVLEANMRKTNGTMENLAMTTASQGQTQFINAMNEAIMKVESGAFSYQEALRAAINQCASIGARVYYDTGTEMSLEAAARMNILTGINQTCAKITEMNAERMDVEYYETSAHAGARLEHQEWQGQVFKIEGADADYDNFYDATGYGEVTGLCGVNCRHSFYPFWPGISKSAYTKDMLDEYEDRSFRWGGELLTEYEASQIMRRYERAVRESKRKIGALKSSMEVCEDESLSQELAQSLQQAKQTYNARRYRLLDFCKETGFDRDYLRTKVGISSYANVELVNMSYQEVNALSKFISKGIVTDDLESAVRKLPDYDGKIVRSKLKEWFRSKQNL